MVDEIPKGATGKVSGAELSARFTGQFTGGDTALKNELEEEFGGIYQAVLGAEIMGPNGNFFGLGGDSIRATQVVNRVRALFEVNLSIATIFRKATVSKLAAEIAQTLERSN